LSEHFTGFRTYEVSGSLIEQLHQTDVLPKWDGRYTLYPNLYVELRDELSAKHTVLGRVDKTGTHIKKLRDTNRSISGISSRNREQVFAIDALMDDKITTVILTGSAGTGKTILALAAAMEKIQKRIYKKVILTRPMSHVGKHSLGALPGDAQEKFSPYLLNYITNMEQFGDGSRDIAWDMVNQYRFELVPPQLLRGASFKDSLIIADEVQIFDHMEILTLGTRVGENSKIIIMGDLNQRDERIAKDKTGIYKMMNDKIAKESDLVAAIELQQCERSPTAKLFSSIFEE